MAKQGNNFWPNNQIVVKMFVLTGTGAYAYRRKDGVYVVPIGCLKD